MQNRSCYTLIIALTWFITAFFPTTSNGQSTLPQVVPYSWTPIDTFGFNPADLVSPEYVATVIIGNPFSVVLIFGPDCGFCNGTITTNVLGGVPPYTYSWSTGATTANLMGLCAGQYTVTVTSATGETKIASTVVPELYSFFEIESGNGAPCNFDSSQTQPPVNTCEKVCPGATVVYQISNFGGGPGSGSFIWNVTGAASYKIIPPGNKIAVTWGNPGAGNITAFSTQGCGGEDVLCVTIVDQPVARFVTSPAPSPADVRICKGQTVYFTNQSEAASRFEWDFGDNSAASNDISPYHQYTLPGTYTVRLIAQSTCFCADTAYINVQVLDAASLELDCVGTVCSGTEVTYNATGNCSQFLWGISPNGTITAGGTGNDASVTVLWNAGSEGIISLLPLSCPQFACPEPALFHVPVIDDLAEIQGQERVCPGTEEIYTIEPFGGTNFVWTLSGGGTIIDGQGTNTVTVKWSTAVSTVSYKYLIVKYDNCYLGCSGEDAIPVKILPTYVIEGPVEQCDAGVGVFNSRRVPGALINTNWTVIGPDGAVAWTSPAAVSTANISFLNGPGFYRIFSTPFDPALTCTDKTEWAVSVVEKPTNPTGIAGPSTICPGKTVTYSETGAPHDYKVQWSIVNGPGAPVTQTGSPLNITWSNTGGPYLLALQHVSTDGNNCVSDTIQMPVNPLGQFSLNGQTNLCEGTVGTYLAPAYDGMEVQWSIVPAGAGVIKSGQTSPVVEIYWTQAGTHTVVATICGQSASFAAKIFGNPNPVVSVPANGVCPGQTLLAQTSFPYTTYSWKTAQGATLGSTPTMNEGSGSFTLHVTDANGCKGEDVFSIDEYPEPNITLSTLDPTGFCANSYTVTLRALTENDGAFSYEWHKDGAVLGVPGTEHQTNQYGTYDVKVTNSYGCAALSNSILLFEDCSGLGGGNCPGGVCQKCPDGSFDIQVNATTRCDSFEFQLVPNTPLYLPGGVTWYFGFSGGQFLGQVQGDDTPTFVFPNSGQYIAAVYAKLTNGLTCFLYDSAVVAVKAQFDPVPVCPGEALQFEDESTLVPTRNIAGWAWKFDDPASGAANTSTLPEPTHVFAAGDTYAVELTVTANTGCTSSVVVPVDIPDLPVPAFTPVNAPCPNNATELALNPDPTIVSVEWTLGDPASGAANTASGGLVYHNYANVGLYNITATATNTFGCSKTSGKTVNIAPNPLAGLINPANPPAICEGKTRILTAPSTNVASYLWSTGATTSSITIGTEGVYSVTLTSGTGCTFVPPPVIQDVKAAPDAVIKAMLKNDLGQVYGTSYPTLTTCQGEDVFLEAIGIGYYGYVWSGGNGTGTEIQFSEERNNLLNAGTYNYTVTVTDVVSGCTEVSDPFTVKVNPRPAVFNIAVSGTLCDGTNSVLSYAGTPVPAGTNYWWSTGATTSNITVNQAGLYSLILINQFGCERSGGPIPVHPGPNVSALPSGCLTRCKPDTLCIGSLWGINSWQWYYNGSPIPGATTSELIATQDGSYHAVLTDWFGCLKESDPLTLTLEDGFGTVNGNVWSDVNDNGVVDSGDTLMSGVVVNLLFNNSPVGNATSNAGTVTFGGQPSGNSYEVEIDPASLPTTDWEVVIGKTGVQLFGCDDVEKGDLLVHLNCYLPQAVQLAACEGKSVQYHGVTIPAGSSQVIQFDAGACDSLLTVQVMPLLHSTASLSVQVCQGQMYQYQGASIPPGLSQQFVLVNAAGCDSTVTVSVAAIPPPAQTIERKVCPNDVFTYQGVTLAPGQSQTFTLQTAAGCDSVVTVNVSALATSAGSISTKVCPGGAFVYQGVSVPAGQTQQFVLQNYLGCDSVVTVSVSALATSAGSIQPKVCPGNAFVYQGVSIPAGQTQQFVLQNYLGCDSVVTVTVGAYTASAGSLNQQVCADDAFVYQGVTLLPGQSQQFFLQNYLGCDSVVTVSVSAYVVPAATMTVKVCQGDVFTFQGTAIPAGQSQQFTLQNQLGCDSSVVVNVGVLPEYDIQKTVSICPGTTYLFNGVNLEPGETHTFHYSTHEVCDSVITITVAAYPSMTFNPQALKSCPNTDNGTISVANIAGGTPPFEWSLDGNTFQTAADWSGLAPGNYVVVAQDQNDCLFEQPVTVEASLPLDVILPEALLPCDAAAVVLAPIVGGNTIGGVQFKWHNGSAEPQIQCTTTGPVWVEVTNLCETVRRSSEVNWADAGKWDQVYVPNIFGEKQDNEQNSVFRPFFVAGVEVSNYHLEIFDRWGNLTFTSDNPDQSWDGPMVDQMMQGAVFVWQLTADLSFCGRKISVVHVGDVTLLR